MLIIRVNPDVRLVINGFCKPMITSRKSIPHLSNPKFGFIAFSCVQIAKAISSYQQRLDPMHYDWHRDIRYILENRL
jgi:hypothetical protein